MDVAVKVFVKFATTGVKLNSYKEGSYWEEVDEVGEDGNEGPDGVREDEHEDEDEDDAETATDGAALKMVNVIVIAVFINCFITDSDVAG